MKKTAPFIVLIFLLACTESLQTTKLSDKSVKKETTQKQEVLTSKLTKLSDQDERAIDIMVAFLWPKSFDGPGDQENLVEILQLGRELRQKSEENFVIDNEYENKRCDEIFSGELIVRDEFYDEDEASELDSVSLEQEEYCYDLEDKINETTLDLFVKQSKMKELVLEIGGEWIETFSDFENVDESTINHSKNQIYFSAFGLDGDQVLEYFIEIPEIKKSKDYLFFKASFDHKALKSTKYEINVSIDEKKFSTIYNGDLTRFSQDQKRSGIIYWQILNKKY